MSTVRTLLRARRILGCLLIASVPQLLVGSVDAHFDHRAGGEETPVLADAIHAGQANHWESADSVEVGRCPVCLAPAPADAPAPSHAIERIGTDCGAVQSAERIGPRDPGLGHRQRPRAPPHR